MSENAARFRKFGSGSYVQHGRIYAPVAQRVGRPRRLSGIQLLAIVVPLALAAEGIVRVIALIYD